MQISLRDNERKIINQFISYFCVGGVAAIVEWIAFALFANVMGINYLVATCAAFVFSTTTNWFLGKKWTFKDSSAYKGKEGQELALVFLVSGIGLLFNLGLMYLFVSVLGLASPAQKTFSKIAATGIVFSWNFLIRKLVIYRK